MVELLKKRGNRFLVRAERDMEDKDYDGVCFNSEEALQLWVKALLFKYFGEIPRTHGSKSLLSRFRNLLYDAGKIEEAKLLGDFVSEYRDGLNLLEESYIMSRYGDIVYGEKQGSLCLEAAKRGLEVLQKVERKLG
mgnify:CR=1 FL=1